MEYICSRDVVAGFSPRYSPLQNAGPKRCERITGGLIPLLVRRGGRATKKWSRSEKARTGWSLASHTSQCVLKHLRVSDHPVCGASVASRLFIDAAATPPYKGGECAHTEQVGNSFTPSKAPDYVCKTHSYFFSDGVFMRPNQKAACRRTSESGSVDAMFPRIVTACGSRVRLRANKT
jgi:hypothetical protein